MKKIKTYPQIGEISYQARAQKHIRISIKNAEIKVSYPKKLSFARVEAFVKSKRGWLLDHAPHKIELTNNLQIGRRHRLKIGDYQPARLKAGYLYAPNQKDVIKKLIKKALLNEAQTDLTPIVQRLTDKTNLQPRLIRWRYMKSQWGSCNPRQIITLNTALVYLNLDLIEYVVIHELCHLKHLNHSANFWQLVAEHCPNYRQLKLALKQKTIDLVIEK